MDYAKILSDKEVTEKELEEYWPQIFAEFKERPDIYVYLKSIKPKLSAGNLAVFTVNNSYIKDELLKDKNRLIFYLKKYLKTSKFDIKVVYVEDVLEEKATTHLDKIKILVSKNPVLEKFLKNFDLEVE